MRALQFLRAPIAPLVLLAGLLAVLAFDPLGVASALRERGLDQMLALSPARGGIDRVVLVDIDRAALERHGPWPWPRERQADLIRRVAEAGPAAIGVDVAHLEPDAGSPAALARRLGAAAGRPDIAALADALPDGDAALAEAIAIVPAALAVLLDPDREGEGAPPLTLALAGEAGGAMGALRFRPWSTRGAVGPGEPLRAAATGFGVVSLPVDADGIVRRAPLLARAGDRLHAGLALEVVRLGEGVSLPVLDRAANLVELGSVRVPLGAEAEIRLKPAYAGIETIGAGEVLAGAVARDRLAGRLVIVGGGAPELGGLRATPFAAAIPGALIQASATAQILAGDLPAELGAGASAAAAAALGLLAALSAGRGALAGVAVVLTAGIAWAAGALGAMRFADLLVDPVTPPAVAALVLAAAIAEGYSRTRAAADRLRRRFAQRLAPEVVERIVADPAALKLDGALREVTILFTDVEAFTAMTNRSEPKALIAALDRYVDRVGGLVVAHGGMVDKIVGDAVHAIFNAPLDLEDHATKAVRCALAVIGETEALRAEPEFAALGFGRTRVGVESGPAVVGDVGGATRLDYTAHGDVINMAARLEAANKELGTSILVGPGAVRAARGVAFIPRGALSVKGVAGPVPVCEPVRDPA
jgi:adenylate cyclase